MTTWKESALIIIFLLFGLVNQLSRHSRLSWLMPETPTQSLKSLNLSCTWVCSPILCYKRRTFCFTSESPAPKLPDLMPENTTPVELLTYLWAKIKSSTSSSAETLQTSSIGRTNLESSHYPNT